MKFESSAISETSTAVFVVLLSPLKQIGHIIRIHTTRSII
jgi:hypothetical protein